VPPDPAPFLPDKRFCGGFPPNPRITRMNWFLDKVLQTNMKTYLTEDQQKQMVSAPPQATWKREFKLPLREAGPPNHHDDTVDSDQ